MEGYPLLPVWGCVVLGFGESQMAQCDHDLVSGRAREAKPSLCR